MKLSQRQAENKPDLWYESTKELFSAVSVTIKATGEVIKLNPTVKQIYTYMIDQYNAYRSDKKPFYEDQRDIAAMCGGLDPKTVYTAIKTLEKIGLLIIKGGKRSHAYTLLCVAKIADKIELNYAKKQNGEQAYDHKKALTQLIISKGRKYERDRAAELHGASPGKSQSLQGTFDNEFNDGAGDVPVMPPIDFDDENFLAGMGG